LIEDIKINFGSEPKTPEECGEFEPSVRDLLDEAEEK
jgi:hypothetical protein